MEDKNLQTHAARNELWNLRYLLLMLANFFTSLIHFGFLTLLPLYALEIGGNNTQAGMMTGLYSLAALLCRPFFGKMLDKMGRKPVVMLGLSLITLSCLSFIFIHSMTIFLAFRIIGGIGFSAGSTAIATVVADILPVKRLAEGIGYFGLSNTFAQAVSPLIGLMVIQEWGFTVFFVCAVGVSLLSMLGALPIKYERMAKSAEQETLPGQGEQGITKDQANQEITAGQEIKKISTGQGVQKITTSQDEQVIATGQEDQGIKREQGSQETTTGQETRETAAEQEKRKRKGEGFLEPQLICPLLIMLLMMTSPGAVMTFVTNYALSMGIQDIGSFFTLLSIGTILARLIFGKLSNRFSLGSILVLAIILMIVPQILLGLATTLWHFLLAGIIYGVGIGWVIPIINTIVVLFASPERKGAALAAYYASFDLGVGGSAIIWGMIAQRCGYPLIYFLAALVGCCALAIYFTKLQKRLKSRGEEGTP